MDISQGNINAVLDQEEREAVVTIYQKNGDAYKGLDASDATMTVVGSESKRVRDARDTLQKRLLNTRRLKLSPEEIRRNRIHTAAAGVTTWAGWDDGKVDVECTPENVRSVLKLEHILEQIESAIAEHSDFFDSPSST